MTGMKEGAGEDPFAEDDDSTGPETSQDPEPARSEPVIESQEERYSRERRQAQIQIPYKFRRDGVQDGRDRVPLFLQPETKRAERDALRELEERFEGNVSLTDLREALVKSGLQNMDEVQRQLEEWGYGMTFDD